MGTVLIPGWVKDLDSFRRWATSDEFPEHGRISYLAGNLWVDLGVGSVCIPGWVKDLESFRRWATSDNFPERGRIAYLAGNLWVDLSMERSIHSLIKGEIAAVLHRLVKESRTGRFYPDGMRASNSEAGLSNEPDGMFLSYKSLAAETVRLREGPDSREAEGTPDMVLEVVSPTSVEKDTVTLRELYWKAGIPEYWLVDPTGKEVQFDILRRSAKGYTVTRRQGGWLKSSVFGKSFRLTWQEDPLGEPEYTLEVR